MIGDVAQIAMTEAELAQRSKGMTIEQRMDKIEAAPALYFSSPIVTVNVRHFAMVPGLVILLL